MDVKRPDEIFTDFFHVPGKPDLWALFVDGNPHGWEVDWLCRIAGCLGAENAFEFGTYNGVTAAHLARCVSGMVWTLDIPDGVLPKLPISASDRGWIEKRALTCGRLPWTENVTQLWGDSATFDYADYAGRCDLVFVMGAHSPAYVRSDLVAARRLVTERGLILWHFGSEAEIPAGIEKDFEMTRLGESRLVVVK